MNPAITRQLTAAFIARERVDGEPFTYPGAKPRAVGIYSDPTLETQVASAGTGELIAATVTVRKAWFENPPEARSETPLQVRGRAYFVTRINTEDPITYEFTLIDRN